MITDHVSAIFGRLQVVSENAAAAEARASLKKLPSLTKDDARLVLPPPNRFAAALSGIVGTSSPVTVFAGALLLCHHPLVCHSAKGAKSLWAGTMKRAFDGARGVERVLANEAVSSSVSSAVVNAMRGRVLQDR